MKKLTLDIDAILVESFVTDTEPKEQGTVQAHDSGNSYDGTCTGGEATCQATQCGVTLCVDTGPNGDTLSGGSVWSQYGTLCVYDRTCQGTCPLHSTEFAGSLTQVFTCHC